MEFNTIKWGDCLKNLFLWTMILSPTTFLIRRYFTKFKEETKKMCFRKKFKFHYLNDFPNNIIDVFCKSK